MPKAAQRGKYISVWQHTRDTVCISQTIAQVLSQITSALQTIETHRTLYIRGKERDENKIGKDKQNGEKDKWNRNKLGTMM